MPGAGYFKAERVLHVQVEYDNAYTGGEYEGQSPETVLIPLADIEAAKKQGSDEPVELAFRKQTKFDSMHIVHYTVDQLFNQYGEDVTT